MSKQTAPTVIPLITLDPASQIALHRQLYDALRLLVLRRQLAPGLQLPSTRVLANEVGVSRMTVVRAFEQLIAEGYLDGKVGAGTYVARALPDEILNAPGNAVTTTVTTQSGRGLSRRGSLIAATTVSTAPDEGRPRAFRPGLPALDLFPFDVWRRLLSERYRDPLPELVSYGDPAGYWPLRQAIAEYLSVSRGVRCTADRVIVISGSQQGLDLAARLLLDPGDQFLIEDPGYRGAHAALSAAGAVPASVPLDAEGLDLAFAEQHYPAARIAYVTPSHQFPLGVVMSLSRRLALLEWAQRHDAWIIEDDYDSEYRYSGRPIPAMQGLDGHERVIYIGTFSKVLFPALRLGYLVVPPDLVAAFSNARALADRHGPSVEQAALADFIAAGHFARHIRRMRILYAERQALLVAAAHAELAGLLEVTASEAGMHLVGRLPNGTDDRELSRRALTCGVEAPALSSYSMIDDSPRGLVLGYTGVGRDEIVRGVKDLKRALGG